MSLEVLHQATYYIHSVLRTSIVLKFTSIIMVPRTYCTEVEVQKSYTNSYLNIKVRIVQLLISFFSLSFQDIGIKPSRLDLSSPQQMQWELEHALMLYSNTTPCLATPSYRSWNVSSIISCQTGHLQQTGPCPTQPQSCQHNSVVLQTNKQILTYIGV